MSKKPVISKEAEVLLKLLRIALGNEKPCPEAGDELRALTPEQWQEVVRLSYEHKVSALAVDGLRASGADLCDGLSDEAAAKLKALLVPWFNDVANVERGYAYYVEVLRTLCQIFVGNGLTPIILKGYGLSLNYPVPSHRGAGDIDVFLVDEEGKPAAERGDRLAREMLNLEVVRHGNEHHSSFTFKGILVENHHELRGKFFKTDAEAEFLQILKKMVKENMVPADGNPGVYYPSATFNALFLMRHTIGNLHHGLVNLRQLVDWVTFVKVNGDEVDWRKVDEILTNAGLNRFARDQNGFMVKYLGLQLTEAKATTDDKIINDIANAIFNPVKNGGTMLQRLTYYYRNRWAKKYFFGESWVKTMMRSILAHLKICR